MREAELCLSFGANGKLFGRVRDPAVATMNGAAGITRLPGSRSEEMKRTVKHASKAKFLHRTKIDRWAINVRLPKIQHSNAKCKCYFTVSKMDKMDRCTSIPRML
jgi:hypothetical protein